MRRLMGIPDRSISPTVLTLKTIDLESEEIKHDLDRLRAAGGVQTLSVGLYQYPEEPQLLEICSPGKSSSDKSGHMFPSPGIALTQALDLPSSNIQSAKGSRIYQVGSCTKCAITIAIARLARETRNEHADYKVELTQPALPLYYRWRKRWMPNDTTEWVELDSQPNIKSLMMHLNGFADLNDILFAYDGKFILPEEGFLEMMVRLTNKRNSDKGCEPFEYSNVNYIFLGMLIETVKNKPLAAALDELVFKDLRLQETSLDLEVLRGLETTRNFATGRLVSSDGRVALTPADYLLANTIQSASMGLRSSVRDLISLTRTILKDPTGERHFLSQEEVESLIKGNPSTPFGLFSSLEREALLSESYVRNILPDSSQFWKARAKRDEDVKIYAQHKAGYVDGFGSGMVVLPQQMTSLVVLCDATGTLDTAECVVNYLLQRLLPFPPLKDVLREALDSQIVVASLLAQIEADSMPSTANLNLAKDLAGTYQHHLCSQKIAIADTGLAKIYHDDSVRSREMPVVYLSKDKIRILSGVPLSLERWGRWRCVDFDVHRTSNCWYLTRVGQDQHYRYERIGG